MKTYYLFIMILLASIVFVSCDDDEDGTPRQINETHTYSQNIRGAEGVRGELPLPDLILTDIIEPEIANKLTGAEIQLANSYLEISGLDQLESPDDTTAVVLDNFTIKVGNRDGVNLGDFSTDPQETDDLPSDIQLSTNQIVNLIQNIFADVTSPGKRARITVSFTPNVDIGSADNVQLNIHFGGIFNYVEVE